MNLSSQWIDSEVVKWSQFVDSDFIFPLGYQRENGRHVNIVSMTSSSTPLTWKCSQQNVDIILINHDILERDITVELFKYIFLGGFPHRKPSAVYSDYIQEKTDISKTVQKDKQQHTYEEKYLFCFYSEMNCPFKAAIFGR